MELKKKVESTIQKIKSDKDLKDKFLKDPVKTLEDLLGVDLPDEKLKPIVTYAKAKVQGLDLDDKAESLLDKLDDIDLDDMKKKVNKVLGNTDLDDKLFDAAKKFLGDKKS